METDQSSSSHHLNWISWDSWSGQQPRQAFFQPEGGGSDCWVGVVTFQHHLPEVAQGLTAMEENVTFMNHVDRSFLTELEFNLKLLKINGWRCRLATVVPLTIHSTFLGVEV